MTYDGRAVANYVLDFCAREQRPITNLSLQKLVFFCHAWCLARLRKPLVRHEFEAWDYGPVLQYLYRDFSKFGSSPITSRAVGIDPETGERAVVQGEFEEDIKQLLDEVIGFYSRRSAGELVKLSHVPDGPWFKVWNHRSALNPGMRIKDADIEAYYSMSKASF